MKTYPRARSGGNKRVKVQKHTLRHLFTVLQMTIQIVQVYKSVGRSELEQPSVNEKLLMVKRTRQHLAVVLRLF